MPDYIRIISREYWPLEEEIEDGFDVKEIQAKTISKEFRNKDNTLSLWAVEDEKDAILAVASCSERLNALETIKIKEELIKEKKLILSNDIGKTPIEDINKYHYNLVNLNYGDLGNVASVIVDSLKDEKNFNQFLPDEIVNILKKAISEGRLKEEKLKGEVKKAVGISDN